MAVTASDQRRRDGSCSRGLVSALIQGVLVLLVAASSAKASFDCKWQANTAPTGVNCVGLTTCNLGSFSQSTPEFGANVGLFSKYPPGDTTDEDYYTPGYIPPDPSTAQWYWWPYGNWAAIVANLINSSTIPDSSTSIHIVPSNYGVGAQTISPRLQWRPVGQQTWLTGCNSLSITFTITAPVVPTVTLTANPAQLTVGESSTLTWSSTNASSCTASGGWSGSKATSGSQSVKPSSTVTYTLTCSNATSSAQASAKVVVASVATVSIAATPSEIPQGSSSTLSWSTTHAVSCTATGAWSGSQPLSGSVSVNPASTSTYGLTCNNAVGKPTSNSATVTVDPPASITSFTATPTQIAAGQSSTLAWSTAYATSCTAGGSWTGTEPTSGSQGVSPTSTSTYTLTCSGAGNPAQKSVTVTVVPPPSVTLTANPSSIMQGQQSTLTWTVTGATSCTASGGWSGSKSTSGGSTSATPDATTTYTLACTGAGGTTTKSTKVTVDPGVVEDWSPPISLGPAVNSLGSAQDVVALDGGVVLFVANGVIYEMSQGATGSWTQDWSAPSAFVPSPFSLPISGVAVSTDLEHLIFSAPPTADVPGQLDLWSTAWNGAAWDTPTALTTLNSSQSADTNPYLLPDGSKLFFASKRSGFYGGWDLFSAAASGSNWSAPVNLGAGVNDGGHQTGPYVTPDGSRLYFASKPTGTGSWDIRYANWAGSSWATSIALPGPINTSAAEMEPALSPDGSRLFFLSDRDSPGTFAIYTSVRMSADTDGDGIPDYDPSQPNGIGDNCWETPNADQADTNANGIGDACENSGCGSIGAAAPGDLLAILVALGGLAACHARRRFR